MNTKPIKVPSYIKKQVLPDEYVIYKLKPSWKIWIGTIIIFLLLLMNIFFVKDDMSIGMSGILFVVMFFVQLLEQMKFLLLTNKRVIVKDFSLEVYGRVEKKFILKDSSLAKINLENIEKIDIPESQESFPFNRDYLSFRSPIIFICKNNIQVVCRFCGIRKKDYDDFQHLLTAVWKKLGNNIS